MTPEEHKRLEEIPRHRLGRAWKDHQDIHFLLQLVDELEGALRSRVREIRDRDVDVLLEKELAAYKRAAFSPQPGMVESRMFLHHAVSTLKQQRDEYARALVAIDRVMSEASSWADGRWVPADADIEEFKLFRDPLQKAKQHLAESDGTSFSGSAPSSSDVGASADKRPRDGTQDPTETESK